MVAGQVVCSFFRVVFEKLDGLIKEDHIGPFWGVKKELDRVLMDFCIIKGVLTDAEQKQFIDGEYAVRCWLKQLNEAAYEADDVLDELQVAREVASQEIGASVHKERGKHGCEDIKRLFETFQEIATVIEKPLGLQKGSVEKSMEEICPGRETTPLATEQHPYGRADDKEELLKLLLKGDYMLPNHRRTHPRALTGIKTVRFEDITICSIVGIGGIGKTTLAQMVYNDDRAVKHFTLSWVCVSNVFDAESIVKKIVPSSDSSEKLSSTRFLLVLDDVWEKNQEKWNKFKAFFRAGVGEGSSIIVTTRLQTVADITSTVPPLCIKGLSEEDCLLLFKKYAFGLGNEEKPALVKIGKEIVDKCGGLPLAVKALARLLRHKNEETGWRSIKDSAIWELPPSDDNNILPALILSYSHLPPLLKQCFVFCSILPQDYYIDKEDLIQQWMAHNLVQPEVGKELEDVGNEIFNALLQLSFLEDAEEDEYYKMHDRMHDLASYIAGDEYSVGALGGEKMSREICKITRHVSLPDGCLVSSHSIRESIQRASQGLRSLIIDCGCFSVSQEFEFFLQYLHRLRLLDLQNSGVSHSGIEEVPDCIGKMIHLRYLNLSGNPITFLPPFICLLRNLQTLKLQRCCDLVALPNDMSKMRSLRHLDIKECFRLQGMPVGIGQLSSLRTLNRFIVGPKSRYAGVTELRGLDLGGELRIEGLEHVKSWTDAKEANLVEKKNICSLSLEWSFSLDYQQQQQQQHQEVIDGLQPHAKLIELSVGGYHGPNSPSWLTPSCVPDLVKISLSYCRRCERLSPLGKLGSLKVLHLQRMYSLQFIVMDDDARTFPSLEELVLQDMPNLQGWSSSQPAIAPVFPRLKRVTVSECPKLKGEVPLSESPVEHVSIQGSSDGMVLGSLHDLHYLPFLDICGYAVMENLPPGALRNLTSLQVLMIHYCDNLKTLPVQLKSLTTLTQLSILHCGNLVSLAEGEGGLRNLSSLKTLHIDDCNALKHLPQFHKASLVDLAISDCPQMEFSTDDFEHLDVLERLKLSRLPKLTCFPKGGPRNLSSLKTLKTLHIDDCSALKHLPQFHNTSLVDLAISDCPQMEFSADDFEHLDVLERLKLSRLPKLTRFPEGELVNLSSLKTLHIDDCNALKHLPQFHMTSLVDLAIRNCPQMESSNYDFEHLDVLEKLKLSRLPKLTCFLKGGSRNLSSLKTLHIDDCNALKHLPQLHMTSLVDLAIRNCPQMESSNDDFLDLVVLEKLKLSRLPKLTCFPMKGPRNLSSLKTLHIHDCNALKHLPQFYKTSLVDLEIGNCPQMEFSTDDFEHLDVLEWLTLHRLPKLTFFPEGIKHTAKTLRRLDFQPCSESGAMDLPDWISTLTSLCVLSISVPKNWKMLPQWLQDFTDLCDLSIYGCDEELGRRSKSRHINNNCFKMISHVSFVRISSNVWS